MRTELIFQDRPYMVDATGEVEKSVGADCCVYIWMADLHERTSTFKKVFTRGV
jgi:hypothetical protein